MVAAWIRALTGVGPSMASGSHVWSGICADLATAPTRRRNAANSSIPLSLPDGSFPFAQKSMHCPGFPTAPKTTAKVSEWNCTNSTKAARIMPTSPMTFITNALRAANTAERR